VRKKQTTRRNFKPRGKKTKARDKRANFKFFIQKRFGLASMPFFEKESRKQLKKKKEAKLKASWQQQQI